MINSLINQVEPVNIYVSISCEEQFTQELLDIINFYTNNYETIKIMFQTPKLSQFEHYKILSKIYIHDIQNTWCLFCDDDDFCHPLRSSFYLKEINSISIDSTYQSIYFVRNALQYNFKEYDSLEPTDSQYYYNKLSSLVEKNEAKISDFGQEYFMFCCKFNVLKFFVEVIIDDILRILGCDLCFRNLLRCLPCKIINNDGKWLYAHRINYSLSPATLEVDYDNIIKIWDFIKYSLFLKWKLTCDFDLTMKQFVQWAKDNDYLV